jgi:hypothetical protein
MRALASLGSVVYGVSLAPAAEAYIGPGAGLGVLGILLAVVATVLMGLVGLVMWPMRALTHRRKLRAQAAGEREDDPEERNVSYEDASEARKGRPTD